MGMIFESGSFQIRHIGIPLLLLVDGPPRIRVSQSPYKTGQSQVSRALH